VGAILIFYKLDKNKNVVPATIDEIEKILTDESIDKIVKKEYICDKFVSTIFLSMDYNFSFSEDHLGISDRIYIPIVFETLIYDESTDKWMNYQDRYSTWKEAEEGHECAVNWVKNGCKEDEI
jgi:hypothetical protein